MMSMEEQENAARLRRLKEAIRLVVEESPLVGIRSAGSAGRCIPFRDYMAMCLYHPEYGYYRSGKARVGREGDFYTSAFVGDVMGEQLAEKIAGLAAERYPGDGPVEVIDWGGGTGRLGRQMLDAWSRIGEAGSRFRLTVVDGNPEHRSEAARTLEGGISAGKARVQSVEEAESENRDDRPVFVTANELLDAFPVRRVVRKDGRLWEWAVAWDETAGGFAPCRIEPSDARPAEWLERQGARLLEGQTADIGLDAADWTARLASATGPAVLVLIDYGDVTAELTGPHRMDGTLLCYENHRAHADPYSNPGACDITAHVDFDLVRDRAAAGGWKELWYGTQKHFLVESGVLAKLAGHAITDPFHPIVRRNRAIRQLLLSDGMSESFKVQIWAK